LKRLFQWPLGGLNGDEWTERTQRRKQRGSQVEWVFSIQKVNLLVNGWGNLIKNECNK
jgi:hypothetical protein